MNSLSKSKTIPTVVLAGGHKNIRWHDITTFITDMYHYHEHYIPMGSYKTVREIAGVINGEPGSYPVILYLLNTLTKVDAIGEVKIVGPKCELEKALQKANFPTEQFEIIPQGDSFGENLLLGYESVGGKGHVLQIMGDSPLTSAESIENFIEISKPYLNYDIIIPMVKASVLNRLARFMPRPYLRMLPDGLKPEGCWTEDELDKRGRIGVRLSSLAMTDLEGTTVEQINHLRSLRKVLRPEVQRMIRKDLGANVIVQYRRGIPFSWLCKKFEELYFKSAQIVSLPNAGTAIDVDSSSDLRSITRIFNYREKRKHFSKNKK